MRLNRFTLLFLALAISSCGGAKDKDTANIKSDEEMYNEALDSLENKSYKSSIKTFEDLERTYPYSKWSVKGEIMSAYASYRDQDYATALLNLERYIKLHPGNEDIAYAYYLRALCYFEQISNVDKDQSYTQQAKDALNDVVVRFPDSKYYTDALIKIDLVNDHLAGKEVEVGRFYLKQGNYSGAINRFKIVVEKYQTTSHIEEALHRLVEANMALGLKEEAKKYAAVLGYNFPGSKWYAYSYKLIEGKKLPENEAQPDKQTTFSLPFIGKKSATNSEDNSRDLVREIEKNSRNAEDVVEEGTEDFKLDEKPETQPEEQPKKSGIRNWFKGLID